VIENTVDILLVEDNPNDVKLTLHAFRRHRFADNIHIVRDGAEAIEFLFQTDRYLNRSGDSLPKLILLDLKLPLIDGIEVLKRIKNASLTKHVPVVVLTSSQEDRDLVESYRLGVNSYILKPVDFDEFSEVIRQLGSYWMLINQVPRSLG
jgi:two-component system, response regulator